MKKPGPTRPGLFFVSLRPTSEVAVDDAWLCLLVPPMRLQWPHTGEPAAETRSAEPAAAHQNDAPLPWQERGLRLAAPGWALDLRDQEEKRRAAPRAPSPAIISKTEAGNGTGAMVMVIVAGDGFPPNS